MRVLILANSDKGLYNFRKELIDAMTREKYEVFISVPNGERINDLIELGCNHIFTEVDRRGTNPIKDLVLIKKYNTIIKEVKPDVVLTYTIKPNIYGGISCRINKIPYIVNVTGLGTALENKGLLQKVLICMYKIALKKVTCCFAQNKENLEFLKNNIKSTNKYKLLPGSGVNLEKFKLLDYPKENEKMKFLFMSRIMKEKGIDQYIDAAKYITSKYSNVEFHIIGACEERYEELLRNLEKDNVIVYHGVQKNVVPFIEQCVCLVHPSYYPEGMSNVLQEASASGRPVITTDRSGCREIVDNLKTGFIVPIKDSEAVIKAVENFINLPYEEKVNMGVNARKKVEKEFDRNIVINKYFNEIENIKRSQ